MHRAVADDELGAGGVVERFVVANLQAACRQGVLNPGADEMVTGRERDSRGNGHRDGIAALQGAHPVEVAGDGVVNRVADAHLIDRGHTEILQHHIEVRGLVDHGVGLVGESNGADAHIVDQRLVHVGGHHHHWTLVR